MSVISDGGPFLEDREKGIFPVAGTVAPVEPEEVAEVEEAVEKEAPKPKRQTKTK